MTTKRVIQLVRVSTSGQAAEGRASIPSQKEVNERTARAYDLTIVRTIEISDVSGTQVLLAPEIQEMILLMRDSEIHGVVAREFSRLMRPENFTDYAFLQAFSESNTLLYLPEGPIDFSSKSGRLMGTIRAAIAGMERTEMLERIWASKETKRREGGFSQSRVCLPFGVDYDGKWHYANGSENVREAFRLILCGQTSYCAVGRAVGIEPYNLRVILRNPIYTGWRVIDKRRDPSPRAKKSKANGRQADRPKIKRAPEDVIRVQVIKEGLISVEQFNQVQRILDLKKKNAWRHIEGYEHRWTYNGYLNCTCGALIYTKYRRVDYYVCKDRCGVSYMRRDRLDPQLDKLFTKELTRPAFLKRIVRAMKQEEPRQDTDRLQAQLKSLDTKNQRILDAYFEGVINPIERDMRQAEVLRERKIVAGLLERAPKPNVSLDALVDAFAPFVEFDLMNRTDKRQLLNTLTPSIVAANYRVAGLWVALERADELTRTDMGPLGTESPQRLYLPIAA